MSRLSFTAAVLAFCFSMLSPAHADEARGKRLFLQCAACHALNDQATAKVGPALHGMFTRPIAAKDGYDYSPALKKLGGTWDKNSLDRWLAKPAAVAPGTKMVFAGMANDQDRADLIAYLQKVTTP